MAGIARPDLMYNPPGLLQCVFVHPPLPFIHPPSHLSVHPSSSIGTRLSIGASIPQHTLSINHHYPFAFRWLPPLPFIHHSLKQSICFSQILSIISSIDASLSVGTILSMGASLSVGTTLSIDTGLVIYTPHNYPLPTIFHSLLSLSPISICFSCSVYLSISCFSSVFHQ